MNHETRQVARWANWLLPAALALAALSVRLLPGLRIVDDAYITYRYALNIAHGQGFVYNPDEFVLGTTTPLYTLLLAITGWLTKSDSYPAISITFNALVDTVGVVFLYDLARRLFSHWLPATVVGLLWVVAPRSVTFAIGGMETSLFVTLMLATFNMYIRGHFRLTALLGALATLTRPDALIFLGPVGLAIIIQRWIRGPVPFSVRLPWAEGLIYVSIIVPWLIFGALVFGSPLTNSISAKSVAYILPPTQGLVAFLQSYSTPFMEHETFGAIGAMIGSLVYTLIGLLGAVSLWARARQNLPLVVFPWVYALIFIIANPLIFRWYLTPPLPVYLICLVAGAWFLSRSFSGERFGFWFTSGIGVFWLLVSLNSWVLHPDHGPNRPAPKMAWFKLELLYEQAALSIKTDLKSDSIVAAGDIGAVGWYSGAHLLDTLGLVSPESIPYYPLDESMIAGAPYAVSPDLIVDYKPDYLIILETYGRNTLLKDERFLKLYRVRKKIVTDIYDSDGLLIFELIR